MTPHIGDQNVERLLTAAYQPETPDPAFVARIEARLCAAAQELAAARSDQGTAPEDLRLRAVRRRLGWAMGVAAAVAVVALALHAGGRRVPQSTGSAEAVGKRGSMDQVEFGSPVSYRGMTARARPAAPAVKPLAVGEVLTTQVGQRRRVTLADGSVVYLNQNTSVTQVAPRHLELSRGEIYLEVAPREAGSVGATFLVKTPTREVAALGTRFAVDVNRDGTGVVVTQGTVKVSGLEAVLRAGQQVAPGALRIAPAQRASYVLDWTRELMAAAESPLVPGSKHAGGALVAVDPQGQEVALTLRKYHLDIHIEDGFARTTIDQTYFNHEYGRLEGTFYFPLPADAALSRLAMYVEENGVCRLMEGGMAERDHARNVFETIRYTQRDPALLEWVDGSTFKMRVFPLEGRKEKRLLLSYTQKLPTLYGKTTYRFPTGHSLHHDLSFRARVKHGAALTWDSATPLQASREGDDLILTANKAALDRDFVLSLSASAQAEGVARFSSFTHEDAQYLMLRYRPRLASPPQRQRRDWVFLFESSANRDPLLARVQIDVIRTLLLNADHDDTFAVLTAATRVHRLAEERQPVTPENIQAAVEFLEGAHLIGALDLEQALKAAAPFLKGATNPYLVHVGAGFAAIGERNEDVLAKGIPDGTRYVGVGVGKRWSRAFMKLAADRSGGAFAQINPDEPVAWRAFDLLATLNTPRLMDVRVVDSKESVKFLIDTSAVSQGEEICAIARLDRRAGGVNPLIPKSVTFAGKLDGKPFVRELAVKNVAANAGYLPRQWAKLEIDRLLADGGEKNRQRIVKLSKAMYVMSPYTSLLVLETDADYARFSVDRGRKDHWAIYECPERIPVVYEPVAQAPASAPAPARKDGKKSVEDVLSTIVVRVPPRLLRWPSQPDVGYPPCVLASQLCGEADPMQDPLLTVDVNPEAIDLGIDINYSVERLADISVPGLVNPDEPVGIFGAVRRVPPTNLPPPPGWGDGIRREFLTHLGAQRGLNFYPLITPSDFTASDGTVYRLAPLAGSFYGRSGAIKGPRSPVLVDALKDLGVIVISGNNPADTEEVMRLIKQLEKASSDSAAPVKVVSVKGVDPLLVQQAIDALQGHRPWKIESALADFRVSEKKKLEAQALLDGLDRLRASRYFVAAEDYAAAKLLVDRYMYEEEVKRVAIIQARLDAEQAQIILKEHTIRNRIPGTSILRSADDLQTFAGQSLSGEMPIDLARLGILDRLLFGANGANAKIHFSGWLDANYNFRSTGHSAPRQKNTLLHEHPAFTADARIFSDLASYAPGMNTSEADIFAVLEAEAPPDSNPRAGNIDAAAKALIDRARQGAWQVLTVPASGGQAGYKVVFNSAGQYAVTRTLSSGLRETVICDGTTLLHLYPELGIGARRAVSRFHRAEAAASLPWVLPPVEDLARGADVVSIDKTTVAIVVHRADAAKASAGKPAVSVQARLLFTADGRLAERQLVLMPAQKLLFRETYDGQGTIKQLDPITAKVLGEQRLPLAPAKAPNLKPDTSRLIVLPMPLRTREHVIQTHRLDWHKSWANLEEDAALQLFAADWASRNNEAAQVFGERFHAKGDRRLGFYTLLADSGNVIAPGVFYDWHGVRVGFDIAAEHPQEPLAKYLAFSNDVLRGVTAKELGDIGGPGDGFVQRLAAFRKLWIHWTSGKATAGDTAAKRAERERALAFVRQCHVPAFALAILGEMWRNGGHAKDADTHTTLAEGYEHLGKVAGLGYIARYECARNLLDAGVRKGAAKRFVDLYAEVRKTGGLPRIDASFPEAFRWTGIDQPPFAVLMRRTAAELAKEERHGAILTLAWQCSEVGEQVVADELFGIAVAGVSGSQRQAFTLSHMAWLWQTGQLPRADLLLQSLLADAKLARRPDLWRLAATLAQKRGMLGQSAACLEKALDREYRKLPEVVNLETVRSDYGGLLELYRQVAVAVSTLENEPRRDLLAGVIRAADRWRSLDSDSTAACQAAAKILQTLGARDLAWDYLTTPIGLNPNEAAPWVKLAQTLRDDANVDLADRAYALAFAAEGTNAQILWDRAENLRQAGRFNEANALYRQIADGTWQPRFQGLVQQARGMLHR